MCTRRTDDIVPRLGAAQGRKIPHPCPTQHASQDFPMQHSVFRQVTVRSTNAPTTPSKPLPGGIGRHALCDRGEDVNRVDRRLSKVIWPELKQSHSMRRKFSNFLKDLTACRSDDVDLSDLVLMSKKFGARNCQPVLVPLRYACDDCDRIGVWMKTKRGTDRCSHSHRTDDTVNAVP